jgi:hypothetical protein
LEVVELVGSAVRDRCEIDVATGDQLTVLASLEFGRNGRVLATHGV